MQQYTSVVTDVRFMKLVLIWLFSLFNILYS